MTYQEICKAALSAPGIESGFVTYKYELYKDPKATRNQGGGFNSSHEWKEVYRVVLYMDRAVDVKPGSPTNGRAVGGMTEEEGTDLLAIVRKAFVNLSLKLPASLAPAKKK